MMNANKVSNPRLYIVLYSLYMLELYMNSLFLLLILILIFSVFLILKMF